MAYIGRERDINVTVPGKPAVVGVPSHGLPPPGLANMCRGSTTCH